MHKHSCKLKWNLSSNWIWLFLLIFFGLCLLFHYPLSNEDHIFGVKNARWRTKLMWNQSEYLFPPLALFIDQHFITVYRIACEGFLSFFPQGRGWRLFVYGCITVAIICDIITEQDWGGGVESGIATLRVGDRGNASFLFWNLVYWFQHGYIYRNSNLQVYAKNTSSAASV